MSVQGNSLCMIVYIHMSLNINYASRLNKRAHSAPNEKFHAMATMTNTYSNTYT